MKISVKRIIKAIKKAKKIKIPFFKYLKFRKLGFSDSEIVLYNIKNVSYKNYISDKECYYPRNYNSFKEISDDKMIFSMVMKDYCKVPTNFAYIKKGILYSLDDRLNSSDDLFDFVISQKEIIIKPYGGADGKSIFLVTKSSDNPNMIVINKKNSSKEDLIALIKSLDMYLIQNRIHQGQFENSIFPDAINTIRLVTCRENNQKRHKLIAAVHRFGNSKSFPVDNFNQGGTACEIDISSGVLGRASDINCKDEKGNQIYYNEHPDTKVQLHGQIIPNWDLIVNTILDITEKIPLWDFVAWDVVHQDNQIALIEINMKTSANLFQIFEPMKDKALGKAILSFKNKK